MSPLKTLETENELAIPAGELDPNAVRDLERLTNLKAHYLAKGPPSGLTNTPPTRFVEPDQQLNPPATIKVVLVAVNQRGRSKAMLPDGSVLISSSRQAFLDSARALTRAGYDPDQLDRGVATGSNSLCPEGTLEKRSRAHGG